MSRQQLILTVSCIILLLALYFGANRHPSQSSNTSQVSFAQLNLKELSSNRISTVPAEIADSIHLMEDLLAGRNKNTSSILKTLSNLWRSTGNNTIGALYLKMYAEKKNSALAWSQAGDQFQIAFRLTADSTITKPLSEQAIFAFEKAHDIDPNNAAISVSLANCLMESTNETMKGVQLLLGILAKDSNHIKANLILGKWGIFSAQFEKAIKRLEKVVFLDPQNLEAYFHLGQALQGKGDHVEAVKNFQKCIELSDNPGFKDNVENIIKNIRNS